MKPTMVLEEQVDLLKWWRSERGMRFAADYIESVTHGEKQQGSHSIFDNGWDGNHLADLEAHRLDRADTYWVSKAMCELVEQAAKKMEPEVLFETSLPTRSGFVYLDKLVHSYDINMQWCNTRAIMWYPVTVRVQPNNKELPAVLLSYYSDSRDIGKDEMLAKLPVPNRNTMPHLVLLHMQPWVFGRTFTEEEDNARLVVADLLGEEPPADWISQMAYMSRFMFSLWKLIQMPIAVHERQRPDRASLRRMQRSGVLHAQEDIRVVTLRKTRPHHHDNEEGDQEAVEWSHRWLVDGHWRWQFYPSRNRHEQIFISPHIKGPEDKPLILKDKVYAWRR